MQNSILLVASLGLLAGCSREAMVVSPQALPALAERQVVRYERTRDGARVVEEGPIRWVIVQSQPSPTSGEDTHEAARVESFRAPFQVRLAGGQLQLADEERSLGFALRDIQRIEVHYDASAGSPAMAKRIVGIVLTSIGGASVVGGVAFVAAWGHSSNAVGPWVLSGPLLGVGTVLAGVGIPLWVSGAAQASPPATAPTLAPTGNGVALRWAF